MVRMFLKQLLFCAVLVCTSTITPIHEGALFQASLNTFLALQESSELDTYKGMKKLFLTFNDSFSKIIKQLRLQERALKKKTNSKNSSDQQLQNLQQLIIFLKKHKIQFEAITFHRAIELKYQHLFSMIEQDEDIIKNILDREARDAYDSDKKYLQDFVKDIRNASHKISCFEDYLHSNDIDLKLQNYVFKMELVKLRNVILFDKRYKQ